MEVSGTLTKRGTRIKTWRRRHVRLIENNLSYYTYDGVNAAKKGEYIITPTTELKMSSIHKHCFYLEETKTGRTLFMFADTENDKMMWINALTQRIHSLAPELFSIGRPNQSNSEYDPRPSVLEINSKNIESVIAPPSKPVIKRAHTLEVAPDQIRIRIIRAKDLFQKGSGNSYVKLYLGSLLARTNSVKNSQITPEWDESFDFDWNKDHRYLRVEIWSEDLLSQDVFLGVVYVPLLPISLSKHQQMWYKLGKRSTKSRVDGEIELEISCDQVLDENSLKMYHEVITLTELHLCMSDILEDSESKDAVDASAYARKRVFPTTFPPLETEMIEDMATNVILKPSMNALAFSSGVLLLTNYRLIFVSHSRLAFGNDDEFSTEKTELTTHVSISSISDIALCSESNPNTAMNNLKLRGFRIKTTDNKDFSLLFLLSDDDLDIKPSIIDENEEHNALPEDRRIMLSDSIRNFNPFRPFMKKRKSTDTIRTLSTKDNDYFKFDDLYDYENDVICARMFERLKWHNINRSRGMTDYMWLHSDLLASLAEAAGMDVDNVGKIINDESNRMVSVRIPPDIVKQSLIMRDKDDDINDLTSISVTTAELIYRQKMQAFEAVVNAKSESPVPTKSSVSQSKTVARSESPPPPRTISPNAHVFNRSRSKSPTPRRTAADGNSRSKSPVPSNVKGRSKTETKENDLNFLNYANMGVDGYSKWVQSLPQKDALELYCEISSGWDVYVPQTEFARMNIPNSQWRITELNNSYKLCPTYSYSLVVPAAITDQTLCEAACFRSKCRFPALSWLHPKNHCSITRSSQPLVGIGQNRSLEDEQLLDAINQASIINPKSTVGNFKPLVVIDARPKLNAQANQAVGKGFEVGKAYENCRVLFMNIENIHVMRKSLHALEDIINTGEVDEVHWHRSLEATGWLLHVRRVLSASVHIVHNVHHEELNVLVHCSDGWDRTAQLTSLSMLMMDPFYRTYKGFQVLIAKEWFSFGHKFADRLGWSEEGWQDNERSPVFLQFLDCVFQCIHQHPNEYEFTDKLLLFLATHIHSGWFGNVFVNCELEIENIRHNTISMWSFVESNYNQFSNLYFKPSPNKPVIIPVVSAKKIVLWDSWFLSWHDVIWSLAWSRSNENFLEIDELNTVWMEDSAVVKCCNCSKKFSLLRRRHHCRACGLIFCETCVNNLRIVKSVSETSKVKVCVSCKNNIDEAVKSAERKDDVSVMERGSMRPQSKVVSEKNVGRSSVSSVEWLRKRTNSQKSVTSVDEWALNKAKSSVRFKTDEEDEEVAPTSDVSPPRVISQKLEKSIAPFTRSPMKHSVSVKNMSSSASSSSSSLHGPRVQATNERPVSKHDAHHKSSILDISIKEVETLDRMRSRSHAPHRDNKILLENLVPPIYPPDGISSSSSGVLMASTEQEIAAREAIRSVKLSQSYRPQHNPIANKAVRKINNS